MGSVPPIVVDADGGWESTWMAVALAVASKILREGTSAFPVDSVNDNGIVSKIFTQRLGVSEVALKNSGYEFGIGLAPSMPLAAKGDIETLAGEIRGDEVVQAVFERMRADYEAVEGRQKDSPPLLSFFGDVGRMLAARSALRQLNQKISMALDEIAAQTSRRMLTEWLAVSVENLPRIVVTLMAYYGSVHVVIEDGVKDLDRVQKVVEDYTGMGARSLPLEKRAVVFVEAQTDTALFKRHALCITAQPGRPTDIRPKPQQGNRPAFNKNWLGGLVPGAPPPKTAMPGMA